MEVTRDNFKLLFPTIEREIKECEYLSIDCEFTGIGNNYVKYFDDANERYKKKMTMEMKYDIVQFGLSIFRTVDDEDEIKCSCYNFYLFKYHVKNSILPSHTMNISCSAFEFLALNSFDFNKLFKHGITYCNVEEEQKLKASLKTKNDELMLNDRFDLKRKTQAHDALTEFNEFLSNPDRQAIDLGPYKKSELNLVKETIEKADLNRCNSPETNLGLKSSGLRLDFEISHHQNTNLWKLRIEKTNTESKNFVFDFEAIAEQSIGFSKVIQSVIHYRKPIVGHNILLDIMHIINQFVAPLPLQYEDFQFITRELFPFIFDTKHMSVFVETLNKQHKVKSLSDLYDYFKETKSHILNKIKLINSNPQELGCDQSTDHELKFHQAGFDSYITGCCFQVLKSMVKEQSKVSIYEDVRFKNKFFNAWSYDVPFLTSEYEQDAKLDRSNVFFIKFDSSSPSDLERSLSTIFPLTSNEFRIDYLDNSSCLVALPESSVDRVIDLKRSNNQLKVVRYDDYKKMKPQILFSDLTSEAQISGADLEKTASEPNAKPHSIKNTSTSKSSSAKKRLKDNDIFKESCETQ